MNFESWSDLIDLLKEVDNGKELHWASVFEQVARMTRMDALTPLEPIKIMKQTFLSVLLTSGISDETTIVRFFEFYSRWLRLVWEMENLQMDEDDDPVEFYRFDLAGALQPFRGDFDRWTLFSHESAEWIAMGAGDWRFLGALLKYGLWDKRVESEDHMLKEDFVQLCRYVSHFYEIYLLDEAYRMTVTRGKFRDIQGELLGDSRRGFRRLSLVVRTLTAALLYAKRRPAAEQYTQCLEVYFSAVCDPLVSADEVQEFLLFLYGEKEGRHVVECIVQAWINLFGKRPYTPRSLVHLCRGTVRKALLQNKSGGLLPNRVAQLPIPSLLKDYILCAPESRGKIQHT